MYLMFCVTSTSLYGGGGGTFNLDSTCCQAIVDGRCHLGCQKQFLGKEGGLVGRLRADRRPAHFDLVRGRVQINSDRHWYLWVTGNDNNDYPPGISLVLIGADPDYARDTDTHLTDLAHLPQVLTKYQFSLPG